MCLAGAAVSAAPLGPAGPQSHCEPYREVILAKLEEELSVQRIWQDLSESGATVGYDSVRRFIQRLCRKRSLPFRRMECGPGEEAQVDFGSGAPVLSPDGIRPLLPDLWAQSHPEHILASRDQKLQTATARAPAPNAAKHCRSANAYIHSVIKYHFASARAATGLSSFVNEGRSRQSGEEVVLETQQ